MSAARPPGSEASSPDVSLLSEDDLYWFNEGTHRRMGDKLGAHIRPGGGVTFGGMGPQRHAGGGHRGLQLLERRDADVLRARGSSGIWEGPSAGAGPGHVYKFAITTRAGDVLEKADPFARWAESPPRTGSVVWDLAYEWGDRSWMQTRGERIALEAPISVYEVHLGSWRRDPGDPRRLPRVCRGGGAADRPRAAGAGSPTSSSFR